MHQEYIDTHKLIKASQYQFMRRESLCPVRRFGKWHRTHRPLTRFIFWESHKKKIAPISPPPQPLDKELLRTRSGYGVILLYPLHKIK